jgi:hypothetical protein
VPRAARVELSATREGDDVVVRVETRSLQAGGEAAFSGDERPLTWVDVEVLAQLEGVEVQASTAPAATFCRFRRYAEQPGRRDPASPG